jgi:phospholipid/cholesterol/gamma-HCH transport system ATP-binding protein
MPDPVLVVEHLVARYGPTTILDDVSFAVGRGEIFLIVGGSGCGKSTLLKHLIGLLRPAGGDIRLLGQSLAAAGPAELQALSHRFGVLYQSGALFGSMTVAENVALPLHEYTDLPPEMIRTIVEVKLGQVGLQGAGHRLPSELSGGMKKRAGLARAMALEPEILFFDEPSSGLDPVTAADLDHLILRLRETQGTTMVIVTHDLASIEAIADRVIMLDPSVRGILAEGRPAALRDHPDVLVRRFFRRVGTATAKVPA